MSRDVPLLWNQLGLAAKRGDRSGTKGKSNVGVDKERSILIRITAREELMMNYPYLSTQIVKKRRRASGKEWYYLM